MGRWLYISVRYYSLVRVYCNQLPTSVGIVERPVPPVNLGSLWGGFVVRHNGFDGCPSLVGGVEGPRWTTTNSWATHSSRILLLPLLHKHIPSVGTTCQSASIPPGVFTTEDDPLGVPCRPFTYSLFYGPPARTPRLLSVVQAWRLNVDRTRPPCLLTSIEDIMSRRSKAAREQTLFQWRIFPNLIPRGIPIAPM